MKMIALDFDDTLHDTKHVKPGHKMGGVIPGSLEAVNKLFAAGYQPYVLTASSDFRLKSVRDWLTYFKFPAMLVTNQKLPAEHYIDDKGIKFDSWEQVLRELGLG